MLFSKLKIIFRKNAHRNAKTHATLFFNILSIEDQAVKCQKKVMISNTTILMFIGKETTGLLRK